MNFQAVQCRDVVWMAGEWMTWGTLKEHQPERGAKLYRQPWLTLKSFSAWGRYQDAVNNVSNPVICRNIGSFNQGLPNLHEIARLGEGYIGTVERFGEFRFCKQNA